MNGHDVRRVWIFDFDGTLSEIVPNRDAAVLHPLCRAALSGLAGQCGETVAVLSSRRLDDLAPRIAMTGLYLGGCSGVTWLTPDGKEHVCGRRFTAQLETSRAAVLDTLKIIQGWKGVELEDKQWSLTVHIRNAPPAVRNRIHEYLRHVASEYALRLFEGPAAVEVPFVPEINKAFGVRALCGNILGISGNTALFYAGDDENDAAAMRWVLERGGIAVTVGSAPLMPGALAVPSPKDLAFAVSALYKNPGFCAGATKTVGGSLKL